MIALSPSPLTLPSFRRHRLLSLSLLATTLAIPVGVLLLELDPRVLDDEALWLKPLKFYLSMAVHAATLLAALWLYERDGPPRRIVTWAGGATAIAILYELIFLTVQAARGTRSHFNDTTAFDEIGGTIMAAGAGLLVMGPAVVGLGLIWRGGRHVMRDPLPVAFGLGLILGGIFAGYSGSAIGANGGPFVGLYVESDPVLPILGWSLTIGDLRVGHFVGLHLMQALPLACLALWWAAGPRFAAVSILPIAALGGLASYAATHQALAGLPLF
ncbi:MAG: hypothetical protein ACU0CI_11405 [Shimia sp.]